MDGWLEGWLAGWLLEGWLAGMAGGLAGRDGLPDGWLEGWLYRWLAGAGGLADLRSACERPTLRSEDARSKQKQLARLELEGWQTCGQRARGRRCAQRTHEANRQTSAAVSQK